MKTLADVIRVLESGSNPKDIAQDLRAFQEFSEALQAGDCVLMAEQAALLRECRAGIDALLIAKPQFAGFQFKSGTLGNLLIELRVPRPQGVMGGASDSP